MTAIAPPVATGCTATPDAPSADFLADLHARGFKAGDVPDMVVATIEAVLLSSIFNHGRPMTLDEAERLPLRCGRWFDTTAAKFPDGPLNVAGKSAAVHRALRTIAELYRLRASRPDADDEVAEREFRRLRARASTYLSIATGFARREARHAA